MSNKTDNNNTGKLKKIFKLVIAAVIAIKKVIKAVKKTKEE